MNDEIDPHALNDALNKLIALNVQTLTKVTRLQAQVLTLQSKVDAVLLNQGADMAELKRVSAERFAEYDTALLDGLKDWLTEHDIASPPKDDPWWDGPQKEG